LPSVFFQLPAPPLRRLVTTLYRVEAPGPLRDHLHPEWGNIRFTLSGSWRLEMPGRADPTPERAAVFGPTDRTALLISDAGGVSMGFGLTALGWTRLVGVPANGLANRMAELSAVIGTDVDALANQLASASRDDAWGLLEGWISARAAACAGPDPATDAAIERVQAALVSGDIATVHGFAEELGMAERTLSRLCTRAFGFAPKRLLRRQRFLRTLAAVGDRLDQPLSLLLDGSYFDQSHFIREFRSHMGMAPLAYFHSPRQLMRRAAAARLKAAGATMQGLHAG
jgi:AraC-like DNA-binding protein